MNIDKFVSTEKQLGNKAWQKPQHVLDAIKKMRERSAGCCKSCESDRKCDRSIQSDGTPPPSVT